jgi:hypothetical protein
MCLKSFVFQAYMSPPQCKDKTSNTNIDTRTLVEDKGEDPCKGAPRETRFCRDLAENPTRLRLKINNIKNSVNSSVRVPRPPNRLEWLQLFYSPNNSAN